MGAADAVNHQFMGDQGGKANNFGWVGLAPQPDNDDHRWSQFRAAHNSEGGADVDRQSLVEGLGTVVFETTLRIKGITDPNEAKSKIVDAKRGETVLGHAAVASGLALTNNKLLQEILTELKNKK